MHLDSKQSKTVKFDSD